MTVLVCGDRDWSSWPPVWRELRAIAPASVIVHGGCRGADKMAGYVAVRLGHRTKTYPADWKQGKAAGPIRNQQMLDNERPGLVIAFHDHLSTSKGTKDMVNRARAMLIPVRVISSEKSSDEQRKGATI